MNNAVKVVVWWDETPANEYSFGRLSRVQFDLSDGTVTATKPTGQQCFDARYMRPEEMSAHPFGLKVCGVGVFALTKPHEAHQLSRMCEVVWMPPASARHFADMLKVKKWLK